MFFLLVLFLLSKVLRSKKELIKQKLKKVKEDMVWNGIIKSINIAYLSLCLSISISFKDEDPRRAKAMIVTTIIIAILMMLGLLALPSFVSYFSLKNSETFLEN